jgi:hypothetical protein
MLTFQQALEHPSSRKLVFVKVQFLKNFFGWFPDSGIWKASNIENVSALKENGFLATKESSISAVASATTTIVASWFYGDGFLYVKPKSGETVFENFYIGQIDLFLDTSGELLSGDQHEARLTNVPSLSLKTSQVFDGRLGKVGAGSVSIENVDNFLSRLDVEPDGKTTVQSVIETI